MGVYPGARVSSGPRGRAGAWHRAPEGKHDPSWARRRSPGFRIPAPGTPSPRPGASAGRERSASKEATEAAWAQPWQPPPDVASEPLPVVGRDLEPNREWTFVPLRFRGSPKEPEGQGDAIRRWWALWGKLRGGSRHGTYWRPHVEASPPPPRGRGQKAAFAGRQGAAPHPKAK